MPGRIYNELFDIAADQYGYLTPDDARALGVDPHRLVKMAERGIIERVAYGLYRVTAVSHTRLDQYMEATLWPRGGGVLSHDTALDLYDLCDINPAKIHLTVKPRVRIKRDIPSVYVLHYRDLPTTEITRHEGIPIVTPLRAIADCVESHLGSHLIDQAIDTTRRQGIITVEQERRLGTSGNDNVTAR